jgi:hypothetical protein
LSIFIYLPRVDVVVVLPLLVSVLLLRVDSVAGVLSRVVLLLRVEVVVVGVVPVVERDVVVVVGLLWRVVVVVVLLLRGEVDDGVVVVYVPELRLGILLGAVVVVLVVVLERGEADVRTVSVRAGCGLLALILIADRSRAD